MTCKAVLFDLDGTLLDTTALKPLREAKDWRGCLANAKKSELYPGVAELLAELKSRGVHIGIVTVSPSFYAGGLIKHHSIQCDTLIAYHDVAFRKPHPEGFEKALRKLGVAPADAIGVGDETRDAAALHAAKVFSVRAAWNPDSDIDLRWSAAVNQPREILSLPALRRSVGAK